MILSSLGSAKAVIIILVISSLLGSVWFIYNEYQSMKLKIETQAHALAKYETALRDANATLESVRQEQAQTEIARNNLENENARVQSESAELRQMLRRHRLGNLAAQKPGLIETRVNRGTQRVFSDIFEITKRNDNEDDSVNSDGN